MAQKVLLFGDIGIDDIIALIYASLSEEVEIIGIVADYGNLLRENALRAIYYLADILNYDELSVPIIAGAEIPMTSEFPETVPEIHGEYGLGPIIPPEDGGNGVSENFFDIVNIIRENEEELIIVNVGRLTSLATMFLLYPDLMSRVQGIYVMGGAFWVPGNITAVSEANFHGDPVAAQIVLTQANNLTIIPLNVTEQAIVTPEMVDYIDQVGNVDIVKPMIDYYYNFYKNRNPNILGSPMHDVLTIMAVENENMFTYQNLPVTIIQAIAGTERGQSIADIRPFSNLEEEEEQDIKNHRIAFGLDYSNFYMKFMTVMSGNRFE
ncbi:nucleoside hydrolase [Oceanobacillus massiliensis]|uniref:nucleoside hydrolase n=1 Tax=Oceanobacillus massiliensis TaxID=1465765 RepID=UPI00301738CD